MLFPVNPGPASFPSQDGSKPKGPVLQGEITMSSVRVEFEDQGNLYKEHDDEDDVDYGEFAIINITLLWS